MSDFAHSYMKMKMGGCLHCDASSSICGVPEADITGILATGGWVPWHDDDVELDEDVEDNDKIPRLKLRFGKASLASAPANDVNTDRHCQMEDCGWESAQVVDCLIVSDQILRKAVSRQ